MWELQSEFLLDICDKIMFLPECSKVMFPGQCCFGNILFLNSCAMNSQGSYVSQHTDNFKSTK